MEVCILALQTGVDIPFVPLATSIHQPTIKEIAMIGGEETLYRACEVLRLTKNDLSNKEDIKDLDKLTNFDIIMTMMNSSDPTNLTYKIDVIKLFSLLLPNFNVDITDKQILFKAEDDEFVRILDSNNYDEFVSLISHIFCLKDVNKKDYNPVGKLSEQIAKKFEERKKKLQELSKDKHIESLDIYSRYMSILNIGVGLDKNAVSNYTVYQLFDSFNRYQLYSQYDLGIRIQLAGGKAEKFPHDWENWCRRLED